MTMNCSNNQLKQLTQFLDFHLHPHASFYNTIDGIIFSYDLKKPIHDSMSLLQKDYIIIDYTKDTNFLDFLGNLADLLSQGKIIFISLQTLKLNPIIYDQLIQIREKNGFNIQIDNNRDLSTVKIDPQSKIFLLYQQKDSQESSKEILNITDHLLDLRKVH